jgi:hypothetical protein
VTIVVSQETAVKPAGEAEVFSCKQTWVDFGLLASSGSSFLKRQVTHFCLHEIRPISSLGRAQTSECLMGTHDTTERVHSQSQIDAVWKEQGGRTQESQGLHGGCPAFALCAVGKSSASGQIRLTWTSGGTEGGEPLQDPDRSRFPPLLGPSAEETAAQSERGPRKRPPPNVRHTHCASAGTNSAWNWSVVGSHARREFLSQWMLSSSG